MSFRTRKPWKNVQWHSAIQHLKSDGQKLQTSWYPCACGLPILMIEGCGAAKLPKRHSRGPSQLSLIIFGLSQIREQRPVSSFLHSRRPRLAGTPCLEAIFNAYVTNIRCEMKQLFNHHHYLHHPHHHLHRKRHERLKILPQHFCLLTQKCTDRSTNSSVARPKREEKHIKVHFGGGLKLSHWSHQIFC